MNETSQTSAAVDAPFAGSIGVGRRDISPPVGIFFRNWGAADHDKSEGLHRPLTVTVLSITPQKTAVAAAGGAAGGAHDVDHLLLVAIDLGWFTTPQTEYVLRGPLLEKYGLDESQVLMCLGHSHATPSMAVGDKDRPGGELIPAFADHVVKMLMEAAAEAVQSQQPATLMWRYGKSDLATNRDLPAPDGSRTLTGYNPKKSADDTLLVGRVTRDTDDAPIATIVNYACHPTTLAWQNRLVSPDYIGAMREVVEANTADSPCLFLQGASGELAPAIQYTGDLAIVENHGRRLGHAVVATLLGMSPAGMAATYEGVVESGAVLAMWRPALCAKDNTLAAIVEVMPMPLKNRPTLQEQDAKIAACTDLALSERMLRSRRRLEYFEGESHHNVKLYTWRIGSALLMGHPLEAYSAFQINTRLAHPGRPIASINLANGSLGYCVPPELADPGLYAWWQTLFDLPSFPMLVDAASIACDKLLAKDNA